MKTFQGMLADRLKGSPRLCGFFSACLLPFKWVSNKLWYFPKGLQYPLGVFPPGLGIDCAFCFSITFSSKQHVHFHYDKKKLRRDKKYQKNLSRFFSSVVTVCSIRPKYYNLNSNWCDSSFDDVLNCSCIHHLNLFRCFLSILGNNCSHPRANSPRINAQHKSLS
jgi:hypothetical protein